MQKIEKTRKLFKALQYIGMGIIILVGIILIYIFGFNNNADNGMNNVLTYGMFTIIVLFLFMTLVTAPMQSKLLKIIILESLNGLVSDVKFNRKKGYSKESFSKLNLAPEGFQQYGCTDYYSFIYKDMLIESTTARAFDEIKIPKKNKKGKVTKKMEKSSINHFYGRIYIIPFESDVKFNVYGKRHASISRKKEMENKDYNLELTSKVKKHFENFEVYYKENQKPSPAYVANILEKLLVLKLQAKGPVSLFVRKKSMVLCIDNGRYYKEVETKNKIDERLIRDYRKDVSMVLSFINSMNKNK